MVSKTVTRNDLTNILNEVLPYPVNPMYNIGSLVTLTTTLYTTPSDGYLRLVSSSSSDVVTVNIQGASSGSLSIYASNNNASATFIRKGMQLKINSSSGNGKAYFYPLLVDEPPSADDTGAIELGTKYGGTVKYIRKSGVVSVYLANTNLTGMTANADNSWNAQLPTGFRPLAPAFTRLYSDNGYAFINENGTVIVHPTSASGWIGFCITYVVTQ